MTFIYILYIKTFYNYIQSIMRPVDHFLFSSIYKPNIFLGFFKVFNCLLLYKGNQSLLQTLIL